MCLAIPGRVTRISEETDGGRMAEVEYPGLTKRVSLLYVPEAREGDHILVQAGFGIRVLTESQAREVLEALSNDPDPLGAATTSPRTPAG